MIDHFHSEERGYVSYLFIVIVLATEIKFCLLMLVLVYKDIYLFAKILLTIYEFNKYKFVKF